MVFHKELLALYSDYTGTKPVRVEAIPPSGSGRRYFRLFGDSNPVIAAYNPDISENEAFFYLTNHLAEKGFRVPKLFAVSSCRRFYLLQDLGNVSLLDLIERNRKQQSDSHNNLLLRVVSDLVEFQTKGAVAISTDKLFPIARISAQTIRWDLNYFKYCFLKLSGVIFDEIKLEALFDWLTGAIGKQPYTLQYRDFQSRNILVSENTPYYIDYQGARMGPPTYDIASFLYQARAQFSNSQRIHLLNEYAALLSEQTGIEYAQIITDFQISAIFRILQTLGAYGYRGLFQRKEHFRKSISPALNNLSELLAGINLPQFAYLNDLIGTVKEQFLLVPDTHSIPENEGLTVTIYSFSLKKGYPPEHPEHGGGFVFDCRFLPNPGRIDSYKLLTGLDLPVVQYLDAETAVQEFLQNIFQMIGDVIQTYQKRGFSHLSVSFGCTGGQHRSVYCAEKLARNIAERFGIPTRVTHRELS